MNVSSLTVLVPALDRPRNVVPLIASLEQSTMRERREGWAIDLLFICSQGDTREIETIRSRGLEPLLVGRVKDEGQYSRKINAGAHHAKTDWWFLGADDLDFHYGWLRAAISKHIETGCLVIGTQDLGNQLVKQGLHATHSLVHRDYLTMGTIDEPNKLLCELYQHNAVDVEFVETAMYRQQFAFADDSIVEHMHPLWHPNTVKRDAVYNKGIRNAGIDRLLLNRRRPLWKRNPVARLDIDRSARKHPTVGQKKVMAGPRQTPRWPKR